MLRLIECVQGSVEIKLECEPAFDYGGLAADWSYAGSGYHEAIATSEGMDLELRLVTDLRLGFEGPRARARTMLHEGEVAFVALGWSQHELPATYEEAEAWLSAHAPLLAGVAQARHVPRSPMALLPAAQRADPQGPQLRAVGSDDRGGHHVAARRRPAATATGTTATAGSATRPSCSGRCTRSASTRRPTTSSTSSPTWWRPRRASCRSCTGSAARRKLEEQELDHLSGYDDARPVRIGNGAYNQKQHDVWGAVLDSIYLHTRSRDQLPDRLWPIIKRQVEAALTHWREPDRGIWEVRGEPKHFTSSKLMCWVAADRGARLAGIRDDEATALRWQAAADEIHADICAHGVDAAGRVRPALRHRGARRIACC